MTDPRLAPGRSISAPDPHLLDRLVLDDATRVAARAAADESTRALALQQPCVIAIVGPPGSGRRTLAQAIAGAAGAASLTVEGQDLDGIDYIVNVLLPKNKLNITAVELAVEIDAALASIDSLTVYDLSEYGQSDATLRAFLFELRARLASS